MLKILIWYSAVRFANNMDVKRKILRLGAVLGLLFPFLYAIENFVFYNTFAAQEFLLGIALYPLFTVSGLYYFTQLSGILKPLIIVSICSCFILLGPENIIDAVIG